MTIIGILLVGIAVVFFYLVFVHVLHTVMIYTRIFMRDSGTVTDAVVFQKALIVGLYTALGTASIWAIDAFNLFA